MLVVGVSGDVYPILSGIDNGLTVIVSGVNYL